MDTEVSFDVHTLPELETLAYQYGRNRTEEELRCSSYYQRLQSEIRKRIIAKELAVERQ